MSAGKSFCKCLQLESFLETADFFMRKKRVYLTLALVLSVFFCVSLFHQQRTVFSVTFLSSPTCIDSAEKTKEQICPQGDSVYGNYCVISNFRKAEKHADNRSLVTLCTQGTLEFLHHVIVLCSRWGGPVSVAVFSPADDFLQAQSIVDDLRRCDFCIRQWVTWHFFYRTDRVPKSSDSSESAQSSKNFGNCSDVIVGSRTAKRKSKGTYPINVGRNLARSRTHTPYIFSIDIELYPSQGVLQKFERMVRLPERTNDPQVWVLPVFEVDAKYLAPSTKTDLRRMYLTKKAISFHKFKCNVCHKIPNLTQWIIKESHRKSELDESMEDLKVWKTVKRSKAYRLQYWEPFFIGTRNEPEFDPHLNWEGKQNKMQIAYEMCLMGYDFHIVQNAFLVHAPGISVYNSTKERPRFKYQAENNKRLRLIKKNLRKKYGAKTDC